MSSAKAQYNHTQWQAGQSVRLRVINGSLAANKGEMRSARRIPVQCPVKIRVQETGEVAYGMSKDLSVEGIGFVSSYVPRYGELVEVHLLPPQGSGIRPLRAVLRVQRCNPVTPGKEYEVGAVILQVRD